jgi:tetratricopeptide (TPR) repeat protein
MNNEVETLKSKSLAAFNNKQYKKAVTGFTMCIEILTRTGSELDLAEMRNNLSVALLQVKDFNGAYQAAADTDLIFETSGDYKRQAMALANAATALESLDRFENALPMFEKASEILKDQNENEMRSLILRRIAEIQKRTGKPLQAFASLESSFTQQEKDQPVAWFIKRLLSSIRKVIIKS